MFLVKWLMGGSCYKIGLFRALEHSRQDSYKAEIVINLIIFFWIWNTFLAPAYFFHIIRDRVQRTKNAISLNYENRTRITIFEWRNKLCLVYWAIRCWDTRESISSARILRRGVVINWKGMYCHNRHLNYEKYLILFNWHHWKVSRPTIDASFAF